MSIQRKRVGNSFYIVRRFRDQTTGKQRMETLCRLGPHNTPQAALAWYRECVPRLEAEIEACKAWLADPHKVYKREARIDLRHAEEGLACALERIAEIEAFLSPEEAAP